MVSENPGGPFVPMTDPIYLPANKPTLDGTFWIDTDNKPYMVYCYEWLQNLNGTMEKIELKPDLSGSVGDFTLMFKASDSPWSREKDAMNNDIPNRVTDGPFLFKTGTGRLGMIWIKEVEIESIEKTASIKTLLNKRNARFIKHRYYFQTFFEEYKFTRIDDETIYKFPHEDMKQIVK